MDNITTFTYNDFKNIFNKTLDNVYKIKSKKIFLSYDDVKLLDKMLDDVIKYKELFYNCNKKKYYEKIKINIHIFLLKLEVVSKHLYD